MSQEADLTTALLMERQILQEKYPLACGCVITSKYGHPTQRGWRLVNDYLATCLPHVKLRAGFEKEKKQIWLDGQFMPKWRDEHGLWVVREEWEEGLRSNEGVFEYKDAPYLLLLGYLGTAVVLGPEKGPKMAGRAICLDLHTGKTFPAPAPEELLRRFGWTKSEG